jgi:hypothetical protein
VSDVTLVSNHLARMLLDAPAAVTARP